TVGLQPCNVDSAWHVEALKNFSGFRIDSLQIALVAFPGGVPQLSINPGHPSDETVGLDGAKNGACLRINLIDLSVPVMPNPECPFGPGQPRVTTLARRGDGGKHSASLRIDFLDAILGDLKQVFAIESSSCMCRDIDRAHHLSARRIKGIQPVARGKPDVLTVIANSMHAGSSRERAILLDDLSV